jgi:hypothetical protein
MYIFVKLSFGTKDKDKTAKNYPINPYIEEILY